ncbi:MAG: HD domain-containing protein [Synergistaceae bacterium]|jgi:putative hydrolase of HD superfamily|nr:HD domain-containing protein [Synergistaceae bacterium]
MITRPLLECIFSAASIERWNDHPHPAVFTELGKQAHKMIIAWVLGRSEEDGGRAVDWTALIEGGIFEFLYRVVVTDIRPPVFHKLMQDRETREQLGEWVYKRLEDDLKSLSAGFARRFREYHRGRTSSPESRILRAAHFLATKWEFDFIYHWSAGMYGVEDTRREIEAQIEELEIAAARDMPKTSDPRISRLWGFISLVGQLTFQKRWAQTSRIPQTSVLAHLFFVAITAYLLSAEIEACPRRARNNFFGGLFHDLPEVLTRDIVSPVKASVEGLETLIRHYEREAMELRIFPLLPEPWHDELRYYTEEEFRNKTLQRGRVDPVQRHPGDIPGEFNRDEFNPLDGRVIEVCDKLAAYIEASSSIRMGLHPQALEEGKRRLYERFSRTVLYGRPVGHLFDLFW